MFVNVLVLPHSGLSEREGGVGGGQREREREREATEFAYNMAALSVCVTILRFKSVARR